MGQDVFEHLCRGPKVNILRLDHRVRVPVADHRNIEVVGAAAASQHRVELLPGLSTGHDTVHSVGRNTLRSVHGGGVTELHRRSDVIVGSVTIRPFRTCRTLTPLVPVRSRTVYRSPFLTQSVALIRSLRSLARVMIRSPTVARLPWANSTCRPGAAP